MLNVVAVAAAADADDDDDDDRAHGGAWCLITS